MLFVAMMRAHVLAEHVKDLPSPQLSHHSGQPCHTSATPPMVWLRSGVCPPLYGTFPPRGIHHRLSQRNAAAAFRACASGSPDLAAQRILAQTYASDISAGPRWILTPAGHALLPKLHTVIKRYGSLGQISTKSREACDSSLRKLIALLTVG